MKNKIILLVIVSLIFGILIGFLTSARLRLRKLEPVRTYFSADHFREGFYKIIGPDDDQKAQIDQILEKHARTNADLHARIRKEIDESFKALRKELDEVLTREQLDKLKEMDKRRQDWLKQNRRTIRNDTTHFRPGRRPSWKDRDPDTIPSTDTEQ